MSDIQNQYKRILPTNILQDGVIQTTTTSLSHLDAPTAWAMSFHSPGICCTAAATRRRIGPQSKFGGVTVEVGDDSKRLLRWKDWIFLIFLRKTNRLVEYIERTCSLVGSCSLWSLAPLRCQFHTIPSLKVTILLTPKNHWKKYQILGSLAQNNYTILIQHSALSCNPYKWRWPTNHRSVSSVVLFQRCCSPFEGDMNLCNSSI